MSRINYDETDRCVRESIEKAMKEYNNRKPEPYVRHTARRDLERLLRFGRC